MKPIVLLALFVAIATAQAQEIPEGVHYKKATPEANQKFAKMLGDLVAGKMPRNKIQGCFNDAIICGPRLWTQVKRIPGAAVSGKPTTFMLPQDNKEPLKQEGRTYNTPEGCADFIKTFLALSSLAPLKIRPLKKAEISYYWSIIPFDIEEPVMAAESNKLTLVLDSGGKGKIFFVELLPSAKSK